MGRQLTDQQRADRRAQQRQQLEDALAELTTSEGWRRWLVARATLHGYSFTNTMLIAAQAHQRGIEPTYIAGFKAWLRLGRCVRKGERGLRIYAPMRFKADEVERAKPTGAAGQAEKAKSRIGFRLTSVFDVSQTDPLPDTDPVPLSPPASGDVEGDSHAHLLDPLVAFAQSIGCGVAFRVPALAAAKGVFHRSSKAIEIDPGQAPNARVSVLIHELCHALLAEGGEPDCFGYALEEVLVESAAYIACASAGLATDVAAVPYIAGWAATEDPHAAIREAAALIDELAATIGAALAAEDEPADEALAS